MVTSLFKICYTWITKIFQANINNNTNLIDWFSFTINDIFFQISSRVSKAFNKKVS